LGKCEPTRFICGLRFGAKCVEVYTKNDACDFWRYDRVKMPGVDDRALANGANEYEKIKGYSKAE
jgi:hypothetical protein